MILVPIPEVLRLPKAPVPVILHLPHPDLPGQGVVDTAGNVQNSTVSVAAHARSLLGTRIAHCQNICSLLSFIPALSARGTEEIFGLLLVLKVATKMKSPVKNS